MYEVAVRAGLAPQLAGCEPHGVERVGDEPAAVRLDVRHVRGGSIRTMDPHLPWT